MMPRLAVLGHPVGHSRSPAMHNAALAALGMEEEWSYEAIEVAPDAFEERVRAMPAEGFAGANVTVPHKGAALAVADEISEVAREIGAANTLVFAGGEIRAANTDADGLLAALPAPPGGRRTLVLGAGGAGAGRGVGAGPRGRRGRGLEPHRAAFASSLRGAGGRAGRRSRAGRLRADRQHDCGWPAGRGSHSRRCRWLPAASPPSKPSSTSCTATSRQRCCARQRPPARPSSTASRFSSSRGPFPSASGPAATRSLDVMRAAARG